MHVTFVKHSTRTRKTKTESVKNSYDVRMATLSIITHVVVSYSNTHQIEFTFVLRCRSSTQHRLEQIYHSVWERRATWEHPSTPECQEHCLPNQPLSTAIVYPNPHNTWHFVLHAQHHRYMSPINCSNAVIEKRVATGGHQSSLEPPRG